MPEMLLLWFDDDMFCLLTLLAYLGQEKHRSKVTFNLVDRKFKVIDSMNLGRICGLFSWPCYLYCFSLYESERMHYYEGRDRGGSFVSFTTSKNPYND